MRFRRLQLHVLTTDGPYGVTLDFPDGLVVVWADNSMGKSTCVKSILVALGMEAMLSANQSDLPLPPAMKARLDSGNGEYDVLESEVLLEIENSAGNRIVVQRSIKGERDKNLITVHDGPVLTAPGTAAQTRDFFVNRPGGATREHGFHRYLADFFNWELPTVQTYDGDEYPLYLQCILPYFVVEQTRGWSTVQPPLPTQFRIRDAHKRAVEFLMNLDAHRVALQRQEIEFEKTRIETEWTAQLSRVADLADRAAAALQGIPNRPAASWPPTVSPSLLVPTDDTWITIQQRFANDQVALSQLVEQEIPRVQEIATSAQAELIAAESRAQDRQATLSRLHESLEMEQQEVSRVQERLRAIEEDIQRNKDVRTLKQLGSRQGSSIDAGNCPICHQTIHDSLVPLASEQAVMSLDENIEFLTEQKRTYDVVLVNARRVADARSRQISMQREQLSSLRDRVRDLRQTLVSDGRLPSIAAIQSRIELENALRKNNDTQEQFDHLLSSFEDLSIRWRAVVEELRRLPPDDVTESDRQKLGAWTGVLREQLDQFGFGSLPVREIVISPDTYRPEHEGFDLETSFSLQISISASDLIRTIWSYLQGLLELSRSEATNHPGCVIFDEPKQQSARDVSFSQLLRRASTSGEFGQQVIFFTSENRDRLDNHLNGLPHTLRRLDGRIINKIGTAISPRQE